ncbi:MAG: 4Fe-4S dicluster domain-containing protein [Aigarchaeota archaeon]|nr:4Fe-4S dicluster domain-containing protein [Aigarchaeota archaeon]MCX8192608.1 4Fe-4S dicluster domain-containing protein [Nitrososphaeria archaeon]MDW7985656.1 4Fe-4S dicluster domain-containing protein [Nitrososphaerota archaeon]
MNVQITHLINSDKKIHAVVEKCIQCGTCSASCPLNQYMDYTPRQLIALVREGMIDEALKSRTSWLCSTCYLCAVRCPVKINIGDFMTSLKRYAIKNGYSDNLPYSKLTKTYVDLVNKYGRISETKLIITFSLKTNPLKLLKMLPLSAKLLREGILSLSLEKVKNIQEIRT